MNPYSGDIDTGKIGTTLSFVNRWQAWLERGEFIIAIYFQTISLVLHVHVGAFDKALYVSRYGISIE